MQRVFHTTVCFCMAQWAYSNHPTDASYSSSLSRCTPLEPAACVFVFLHSSGCRSPNLHLRWWLGRRWHRQCALTGKMRFCWFSSCLRCYLYAGARATTTTTTSLPPSLPVILCISLELRLMGLPGSNVVMLWNPEIESHIIIRPQTPILLKSHNNNNKKILLLDFNLI